MVKAAAHASPSGTWIAVEFMGDFRVFELVDDSQPHRLAKFQGEFLECVQRGDTVEDVLGSAKCLNRFLVDGFSRNAEPFSGTISDLASPPVHRELAFGDPVEPRCSAAPFGVELMTVGEGCGERLPTEIRGDVGVIGTAIEVSQKALGMAPIERIEHRRVAEALIRRRVAHQLSFACLELGR